MFGLQFRTTLLLTCVVLAATGLTGVMYLRISARLALTESKRHVRDMATALATAGADAVEQGDRSSLARIVQEFAPNRDIMYVLFTDQTGEPLATYQRGAGKITRFMDEATRKCSVEPINQPQLFATADGKSEMDEVYPVIATANPVEGSTFRPTIGYVRLGISLASTEARLSQVVRNVIGLAIGITLLMVPLGYEVVRRLVGPIRCLSDATRMFAAGELDARVPIDRRDEFGALGESFNAMADDLARSHNQLVKLNAELEDRVLQRTMALEGANERLREMAVRDSLTGLYNRRHFSELLERLFSEASRYGTDLTCMMLDLDNFKRINDTLGHPTGDRLLQIAARLIRESIRESDVPVRFGGDEFVVLLPRTSPTEACASAERLMENFRAVVAADLPEAHQCSLSIGLASRDQDQPAEAMELLRLADEALYLAKAGGKNRITILRPGTTTALETT
jgi:diguanylate cyclase (GGDEF)-like protein